MEYKNVNNKKQTYIILSPYVEKQFFLFFLFSGPRPKKIGAPDQNSGRSHFSVLVRTTHPEKMNILAQIL